jgi:transmembrane sensor
LTILIEAEKAGTFSSIDSNIRRMLKKSKRKNRGPNQWLLVAAVLLVACALFLFKFYNVNKTSPSPAYTYIIAPKGIKKQFSLPDNTIVYLNSGSIVRIPSNYNGKTREVSLTGEAYFSVKHNAAKPFSIHSGKLLITDLGTTFNVKAYPDEKQIRVAVESGEVKVEKSNPDGKAEVFAGAMVHNQQLTYNEQSNSHVLNQVNTSNSTAWTQNKLRFDNASFDEISHTLERWYNVTVKLDNNNVAYRHYTISFNNEPISKVLSVLSHLSGMSYEINKQSVSINLKNCKKI